LPTARNRAVNRARLTGWLCLLALPSHSACARESVQPASLSAARAKSPAVAAPAPATRPAAATRPAVATASDAPSTAPAASPEPVVEADDKTASTGKTATRAPAAAESPARLEATAADEPLLARGQELFGKYCAICHGEQGDGAGQFAYLMNPRPRNFRGEFFKLYTTQNQVPTDDDLLRTISRGMPGSAMPPWGHLPRTDLQALVRFVRRIKQDAVTADAGRKLAAGDLNQEEAAQEIADRCTPGPAIIVPAEPAFDELRWFRGRRLYLEGCASCHGADGRPVESAVKYDEQGYPVPPRSFVDGIFKGGSEGYQLYARVMKGLRGTPMPSYEGTMSGDEAWDLVHYVQSLTRAGAQERAQLRMGTIVAPAVQGKLPDRPQAPEWEQSRPVYVALTPLWWTDERIEGLVVQALHNDTEVAFRLSWIDPTEDTRAVRQDEFRDGVAIQFSLSPDPPFYMGSPGEHGGVNIWYWKADRQKDLDSGRQDVADAYPNRAVDQYQRPDGVPMADSAFQGGDPASLRPYLAYLTSWAAGNLVADPGLNTSVECLVARGPGTLAGKPANVQRVAGQAVYERGAWYVQMQRGLDLPAGEEHGAADERAFRRGDYLPVSFAVWNGSAGDRDGKKNISIWQKLVIE